MAVPYHTHTFDIPTATDADVAAGTRSDVAVVPSNLGTASQSAIGDFATAAQGLLASTALQPAAIGSTVQAFDTDLTAIAALVSAANKMPYATGAGTWSLADLTAAGRAILDDADATAQRATLGLVIGTNVQAFDAGLASIAGLTTAADQMIYTTASDAYATTALTPFARTVLDDADAATMAVTLNVVPKNADSGVTLSSTTASIAIPPGAFGGLFLTSAFTSNRVKFEKVASDATAGPRFAGSYSSEVLGGHANGPDNQRGALYILGYKKNWDQVGALSGEVDGIYVQVAQGNLDDAGGILIDSTKTFDAGSTGSLTAIELAATRKNLAGTVLSKVRAILGFQEGAGGALNGAGASVYAEAENGSSNIGVAIVNHTANFAHAVAGFLSRSSTARWFSIRWDGEPVFELGSAADSMKIRYTSSAMIIKDQSEASNLYVLQKDGIFRPLNGIIVKSGSSTIAKYIKQSSSVDFGVIAANNTSTVDVTVTGAAVGDAVTVTMSTDYANDKVIYQGRVTSANTVRVSGHNIGTAATADLAAQTAIIQVWG